MPRPEPRRAEATRPDHATASSPQADDGLGWLDPVWRLVLLKGGPHELLDDQQLQAALLAQRAYDTGRLTNADRDRLVRVWGAVPTHRRTDP